MKKRSFLVLFLCCIILFPACSSLKKRLISEDYDIRQSALDKVNALDPFARENLIKSLLLDLESSYWEVKVRAIEALGLLSDKMVTGVLVKSLKDEDKEVRSAAAQSLGKLCDPKTIDPLIELLNDKDADVKKSAIISLGLFGTSTSGDARAIVPLIQSLDKGSDDLKAAAVWAILNYREKAIEPLFGLLKHENFYTRWTAEAALVRLGEPAAKYMVNIFPDQEWFVKWRITKMLEQMTRPNKELADTLGDSDDIKFKASAYLGIKDNGKTVKLLLAYLKDEDYTIRMRAVEYLGYSANKEVINNIMPLLIDEEVRVRKEALAALGLLNYEPASLQDKVRYYVLSRNWVELFSLGGSAVNPVFRMLDNKNDTAVRERAIEALGELKYGIVIRPLLKNIDDKDPRIRLAVVEALGKIEDVDFIMELSGKLKDKNYAVVIRTIQILGQKRDGRASKPMASMLGYNNSKIHDALITALVNTGNPAVEAVASKLDDNNVEVAKTAKKILETINTVLAKQALEAYKLRKKADLEK